MTKIEFPNTDKAEKWLNSFSRDSHIIRGYSSNDDLYKEKFLILTLSPKFNEKVNEIRHTYDIPASGFPNEDLFLSWAKNLTKSNYRYSKYNSEINSLLIENKTAKRWKPCIDYYIFFNKTDVDHILPQPLDIIIHGDNAKDLEIHLIIYKDTTLKDIKSMWPKIIENQNVLNPLNKRSNKISALGSTVLMNRNKSKSEVMIHWQAKRITKKDLTRYIKIAELKNNGKKPKEISLEVFHTKTDAPKVASYHTKFLKIINDNELY